MVPKRTSSLNVVESLLQTLPSLFDYQAFCNDYQTDFAISRKDRNAYLPLKVLSEQESGVLRLGELWRENHLMIAVARDQSSFLFLQEYTLKNPRFAKFKEQTITSEHFVRELVRIYENPNNIAFVNVDSIQRRDIPYAIQSYELEALTQLKLKQVLNDSWIRSNESCRADGAYSSDHSRSAMWLPVQLKTMAKPLMSNAGRVRLRWNLKGHTMLCILHCISTDHLVVIPGSLAKQVSIDLNTEFQPKENSTYAKFLTRWKELPRLLSDLYRATAHNLESIQRHGYQYSLDMLELQALETIMTPLQKKRQMEVERAQNRACLLPQLRYQRPERDGMPFDVYINGRRIQDKSPCKVSTWALMSSLHKSNGSRNWQPYSVGDFDFLWLHIADTSFYLFPAKILLHKGFLTTQNRIGKTSFRVYPQKCGHWTAEYHHTYDEPKLYATIENILGQDISILP